MRNVEETTWTPRFLHDFSCYSCHFSISPAPCCSDCSDCFDKSRLAAVQQYTGRSQGLARHEATRPRGHGGTRCENPELHTLHTLDTFTWLLSNYSQNTSSWKFCLAGAFRLCTSWMAEALYCTERFGRWSHVRPGAMWGMWGTKARNEKKQVENVESF